MKIRNRGFGIAEAIVIMYILLCLTALVFLILFPAGCAEQSQNQSSGSSPLDPSSSSDITPVSTPTPAPTPKTDLELLLDNVKIGDNVAYIHFSGNYTGRKDKEKLSKVYYSYCDDTHELIIQTLNQFQNKYNVQIISWSSKEFENTYVYGIEITFFKPEDKLSETQNSNENSKIEEVVNQ